MLIQFPKIRIDQLTTHAFDQSICGSVGALD